MKPGIVSLRFQIAPALLLGAESALLYLLLVVVARSPALAPVSWLELWTLGCGALLFLSVVENLSRGMRRALIGLGALIAFLLAVHASAYADRPLLDAHWPVDSIRALVLLPSGADRSVPLLLGALLALWWRASVRRRDAGPESVEGLLHAAPLIVVVLAVGMMASLGTSDGTVLYLARYILAFFLLGFLASAFAGLRDLRSAGIASLVTWLPSALLPFAVMLALVGVLGLALSGRGDEAISSARDAVSAVASVAGAAAGLVAEAVLSLARLVLGRGSPPDLEHRTLRHVSHGAGGAAAGGGVSLLPWLFVLAAAIVLFLVRRRYARPSTRGERRESAWRGPDLGGTVATLAHGIRRRVLSPKPDPLADLLLDPVWRHTADVRRTYRQVERSLEEDGESRDPGETVGEFAARHTSGSLRDLADLYQRARYSRKPSSPEDARRARELRVGIGRR